MLEDNKSEEVGGVAQMKLDVLRMKIAKEDDLEKLREFAQLLTKLIGGVTGLKITAEAVTTQEDARG
jgi:hypothetical protein